MKAVQFTRFGDPVEVAEVVELPDPGNRVRTQRMRGEDGTTA
jgi:hypothetical protein